MSCTASIRRSGDVSIIDLAGRIMQAAGSDAVREAIKGELAQGRRNILLNLNGVDFVDSSGLGAMASAFVTVDRLGGRLKLLNTQPRVEGMLHVTSLYRILVTFVDENEALASFT
jgi:anti-sigma B factor antagonist